MNEQVRLSGLLGVQLLVLEPQGREFPNLRQQGERADEVTALADMDVGPPGVLVEDQGGEEAQHQELGAVALNLEHAHQGFSEFLAGLC